MNLSQCVQPLPIPLAVKEQVLGQTLDQAIGAGMLPPDLKVSEVLDAKVLEVLENGGFSFVKYQQRAEIYEYERVSRAGQPLEGKEAKKPPRYQLTRWGMMIVRCSCEAARGTSEPCKHQKALAWWLGLAAAEKGSQSA